MSSPQYRILSSDELAASGIPEAGQIVGVAIVDNKIASMHTFTITNRFKNCDNCDDKCLQGSIVWTDPRFRNNGYFRNLYDYMVEELKPSKIYAGSDGSDPMDAAISWKYGFVPPEVEANPPAVDGKSPVQENVSVIIEMIAKLTEGLGLDE